MEIVREVKHGHPLVVVGKIAIRTKRSTKSRVTLIFEALVSSDELTCEKIPAGGLLLTTARKAG